MSFAESHSDDELVERLAAILGQNMPEADALQTDPPLEAVPDLPAAPTTSFRFLFNEQGLNAIDPPGSLVTTARGRRLRTFRDGLATGLPPDHSDTRIIISDALKSADRFLDDEAILPNESSSRIRNVLERTGVVKSIVTALIRRKGRPDPVAHGLLQAEPLLREVDPDTFGADVLAVWRRTQTYKQMRDWGATFPSTDRKSSKRGK